jgi:hypothetical protein
MFFVLWAAFLVSQNASFTFVSRARNSGSYALHAIAAVCSNGIYFAQLYMGVGIIEVMRKSPWLQALGIGAFYTAFTVLGSVAMHWVGVTYIEKGKRKVGA